VSEVVKTVDHVAPYGEHIREEAFLVWMYEANGNFKQTQILLQSTYDEAAFAAGRAPTVKLPDVDTLRRWCREDDWHGRRYDALQENDTAKTLYWHAMGQGFLLMSKSMDQLGYLISLDLSEPENRPAFLKANEQLHGIMKSLGNQAPTPPVLPPSRTRALSTGPKTREEVTAQQLERVRKAKQPRKGKI
jgi:hypothetical protein